MSEKARSGWVTEASLFCARWHPPPSPHRGLPRTRARVGHGAVVNARRALPRRRRRRRIIRSAFACASSWRRVKLSKHLARTTR